MGEGSADGLHEEEGTMESEGLVQMPCRTTDRCNDTSGIGKNWLGHSRVSICETLL